MSAETSYITTGPYQDIISGVQLILSFSDGVVKLTGPAGSGRTRLLQELQHVMQEEKQRTILFIPPPKSVQDLYNTITRTYSLGADVSFRKALTRFLSSKPRDQQTLFLLIDDADSMDDDTMSGLILLREVKNNTQGLVSIVLCGSPQLSARLAEPTFADLAKDIILNYELLPLDRPGLAAFCKDAIAQHKLGIPVPVGRTLDKLLAETGGLPGKVLEVLPGIVNEPEAASDELQSAGSASPTAQTSRPAAKHRLELLADAGDADTDDDAAPLISSKLRKALYGGAAMAASVAAVYLLYPLLSPMLQKPETTISSSTPATTEVPITTQAETAVVADVAPPEPVEAAVAETGPAPATETVPVPEPASVTDTVPVPEPAQVATLTPPEPVAVPVAPASTTVSLVPAFPAAAQQDDSPAALEALVRTWLTAWQNKDLDQYFQAYHTDFAPLYQNTRAAWRDNRLSSISRPAAISITMEEFTVNGLSSVGTHVSFLMEYQTATYADRTLKELVIGHDLDGSLRILQEINRDVTTLAPREFVPGPDISVIASTTPAPATQPAQTAPAVAAAATPAPAASGRSSGATYTQIGPPVQIGSVFTQAATATSSSPNITEAQTADISNFLGSWLDSWQHQDIDAYFAHYHPDFKSSLHASRDAWQQDRSRKITRPLAIQIHLLNLQVMSVGTRDSELELQMEYHSTYYADRTVKDLRLARGAAGQWLIIEERNERVEALPLSRLVPGNSITMRGGINTVFEHAL
jgi:type II secretory pathway predicted ATPase ExeA/ketosteroid isomerase-like protein